MNKTGKAGQTWVVLMITILTLSVVAGIVYFVMTSGVTQTAIGNQPTMSAQGCNIAPSFSNTGVDALVSNSNVTPANFDYIVNGVYKGSSYTPSYGDNVQVLANPTGYFADVQTLKVGCGVNQVPFRFYANGSATISVKSDSGVSVLTNSAGAGVTNETSMTTTKNNEITLTAPAQKSSGKMFVYVEMPTSSTSNISSVQLSCNGVSVSTASGIPSFISSTNTNAYRGAWEVAPINDGQKVTCNLQQTPIASTTTTGLVRLKIYYMETFVDTDGVIKTGTYTSLGTAKYQDSSTYTWTLGTHA